MFQENISIDRNCEAAEINDGRGGVRVLLFLSLSSFFLAKTLFVNISCLTDVLESQHPYAQAFFNCLSIVEICIDKGLSGGDLCSCQLSQKKAPLDTNWNRSVCKAQLRGLWGCNVGTRACGPKRGEQADELKTSSSRGIDRAGWPLTWERQRERAAGQWLLLSPSECQDHAVRPDTDYDTLRA